jgi:hypothetical protein
MRGLKFVVAATAFSAVVASGIAGAQTWNKRTYLTFSGPVSLPGITLPAGTYTFQIANPDSGSRVIQVMDKDMKNVRGMFFAIPSQLADPPNEPVVRFAERPEGAPEAIKAWFYPGERTGFEFVYPRSQAVKIARANHEKVLSYPDPAPRQTASTQPVEEFKNARVERVDENSQLTAVPRTPAVSNEPPQQSASNAASTESRLPQTASPLALYELLSGLSLAAGVALRARRNG